MSNLFNRQHLPHARIDVIEMQNIMNNAHTITSSNLQGIWFVTDNWARQ